jgi:hypothetical protein
MAHEGYHYYILHQNDENLCFNRYYAFYNSFYYGFDSSFFNIIKNENIYSPHWVYYNKHTAYFEAGITPDELIEMLPRYENLGILSEMAWGALQEKIFGYMDYYDSKF